MPESFENDPPWSRQPQDTDKSWRAFTVYLKMGPGRTVRQLGKKIRQTPVEEGGNKRAVWGRLDLWSRAGGWVARAKAYDNEILRRRIEREAQAAEHDASVTAARKRILRDTNWATAKEIASYQRDLLTARKRGLKVDPGEAKALRDLASVTRDIETAAKGLIFLGLDNLAPQGESLPDWLAEAIEAWKAGKGEPPVLVEPPAPTHEDDPLADKGDLSSEST